MFFIKTNNKLAKKLMNSTKKITKPLTKRCVFTALAVALIGTSLPYMDAVNIDKTYKTTVYAATKSFTSAQQKRVKTIVRVCIDNYDTYGVLPSVCLAQAMKESTMGEHCRNYNLWGIRAGAAQYTYLEEGTIAYLKVINNGYYSGAPFCKDPYKELQYILNGGYCVPVGNYYQDAVKIIKDYDLTQYDQQMCDEWEKAKKEAIRKKKEALRRKRERIRRRKEEEARKKRVAERKAWEEAQKVLVEYDPEISDKIIVASENVASAGAVYVYHENKMQDVYTVVNSTDEEDTIRINDPELSGKKVSLCKYMAPSLIPAEMEEDVVNICETIKTENIFHEMFTKTIINENESKQFFMHDYLK